MENSSEVWFGGNPEALLNKNGPHAKSNKVFGRKLKSVTTLKGNPNVIRPKIIVLEKQTKSELKEAVKRGSTSQSPLRDGKKRQQTHEPAGPMLSPLNLCGQKAKIKKHREVEIKTEKFKFAKSKKFTFDNTLQPGSLKPENLCRSIDEKLDSKRNKSKRAEKKRRKTSQLRSSEGITMKTMQFDGFADEKPTKFEVRLSDDEDRHRLEFEATKKPPKFKLDVGKSLKFITKKQSEDKSKLKKTINIQNYIKEKKKKTLNEKLAKRAEEETKEKYRIQGLEQLEKHRRANKSKKRMKKLQVDKEKSHLAKLLKKKRSKRSNNLRIKHVDFMKPTSDHELPFKLAKTTETQAAITIQRWYRSIFHQKADSNACRVNFSSNSSSQYSESSSVATGISKDNWVNLLESKFTGSNSLFVEEFKAKFTKNKAHKSGSEDEEDFKEKIMSFSSINESSDDSLALEQASKANILKKSTPKVPPLSLELIKHTEEYSQSESNNWKAHESSEDLESHSGEDYSMSESDMNTQWMIEIKSGKESKSELKSDKDSSAYQPGKKKYSESKTNNQKKIDESEKKLKNEIESAGKSSENIKGKEFESDYSSSSNLGFEYCGQKGLENNGNQKMQKGLVELLNDNLGRAGLAKKESFTKIQLAKKSSSSEEVFEEFEEDSELLPKSVGKRLKLPLNLNKITGGSKKIAEGAVNLQELVDKIPEKVEQQSKAIDKNSGYSSFEFGKFKPAENFQNINTKHLSSSSEIQSESEYSESFEDNDSKSLDYSGTKFKLAEKSHKNNGDDSQEHFELSLKPGAPKKSTPKGLEGNRSYEETMQAFGKKNSDENDMKKFEKCENVTENVRKVEKIVDIQIISSNNSGKSVETPIKSIEVARSIEKPKLVIEKQAKGIEIIPTVTEIKLTETIKQKESIEIKPKIEETPQVLENSQCHFSLTETKLITPNDTLSKMFEITEKNKKGVSKLPPLQELPKNDEKSSVFPQLPSSYKLLETFPEPYDLKSSSSSIRSGENPIKTFSELPKNNFSLPKIPVEEVFQYSPALSLKDSAKSSSVSNEFSKSINFPEILGSFHNIKSAESSHEGLMGTDIPITSLQVPRHISLGKSEGNLTKSNFEKSAEKTFAKPNQSLIVKPAENLHLEAKENPVEKPVKSIKPKPIEQSTQSATEEAIAKLTESPPKLLDKDSKTLIEKPAENPIVKAQVKPIAISIKPCLDKPSSNLLDRISENKQKATPENSKDPLPRANNLLNSQHKPEEPQSLHSPNSKSRTAISESFPKLSPKLSPQLSSGRSPKFYPANLPDFTFERHFKEKEASSKPLAPSKHMSEVISESSPELLANLLPVLTKNQATPTEQSDPPTRLIEKPSATSLISLGMLPKNLDQVLNPLPSLSEVLEKSTANQKPTVKILSSVSEPKSSSEEITDQSLVPTLQSNISTAKANFYAKMQNSMLLSDLSPEDFSLGTPDSAKNDSDSDDSINFISLITRNKDLNKPISLLPEKIGSKPSGVYKPKFDIDIEEAIPKIISDEILNFLRIIPFKTLEKEVDFSVDFIIQYLECLASELKVNEEAVLDVINTPIYSEPLARLAMLQDSSVYLSKFPTLELILPPDLCSELKVHFQSLELPSRQIYLQMLFDCVNEALNYIRPFGVSGMPDPWSNSPRILFGEPELENVFSRIISYLIKWASFRTGCFHSVETQNDDDRLQNLREERMSGLLCVDVRDEENEWLKYDEEETQCKILVAEAVFGTLMDEIGEIFKDL